MWVWLDWVAHIAHLIVLQTSWILFHAWSDFSHLSLFSRWICFFDGGRSCYFLCDHSAGATWLGSNSWLARRGRVDFLKRTIKVSATLQVGLGEYNVSVTSSIVTAWFDAALVLLFLSSCRALLGSHQLLLLNYCTLALLRKLIILFSISLSSSNWIVVCLLVGELFTVTLQNWLCYFARLVLSWVLNLWFWIFLVWITGRCRYI